MSMTELNALRTFQSGTKLGNKDLLSIVKYSDEQYLLEQEPSGYVVGDDDDNDLHSTFETLDSSNNLREEETEISGDVDPCVVPVQAHGVIDAEVSLLSNQDVLAKTFTNTSRSSEEYYMVQHGSAFVNEYARHDASGVRYAGTTEDPNHCLGAYFIMALEDSKYSGLEHCLMKLMPIFGVIQKRQVCCSAVLQVQKKAFQDSKALFAHLTSEDLASAAHQEAKNETISNSVICALKKNLNAIQVNVCFLEKKLTLTYLIVLLVLIPLIQAIFEELMGISDHQHGRLGNIAQREGIFGTVEG
ncbi:hypothetical protein BDR05DRAFT_947911 [Suillus weaverae]|nr:hypothetical protein BDR05DRAFT_947911 [Suillus weaverae]